MQAGSAFWRVPFVLALLSSVSGEGANAAPREAPLVTQVVIKKSAHQLELRGSDGVLRTYHVAIGPGGPGPKVREGDQVTPVGRYHVVAHWPSKSFKHFFLIDYPNVEDRERFATRRRDGALPRDATIGGAIGIHGGNPRSWDTPEKIRDWTLGCIALRDDELNELSAKIEVGTSVIIED